MKRLIVVLKEFDTMRIGTITARMHVGRSIDNDRLIVNETLGYIDIDCTDEELMDISVVVIDGEIIIV